MALKVTIFEDDKELADVIKEYMDRKGFEVSNVYSLSGREWRRADVVLADFRNKIVPFEEVRVACQTENIPLLAISGDETGFVPQLLKPFSTVELSAAIMDLIKSAPEGRRKSGSFLSRLLESLGL